MEKNSKTQYRQEENFGYIVILNYIFMLCIIKVSGSLKKECIFHFVVWDWQADSTAWKSYQFLQINLGSGSASTLKKVLARCKRWGDVYRFIQGIRYSLERRPCIELVHLDFSGVILNIVISHLKDSTRSRCLGLSSILYGCPKPSESGINDIAPYHLPLQS